MLELLAFVPPVICRRHRHLASLSPPLVPSSASLGLAPAAPTRQFFVADPSPSAVAKRSSTA